MMTFEDKLFNLITLEGNTGLVFSKRKELTKDIINFIDLTILEHRERMKPFLE